MRVARWQRFLGSRGDEPAREAASVRPALWPRAAAGLAALLGIAALALAVGSADIPLDATVRILASHLPWVEWDTDLPASWKSIIWQVRLPRVLLAGLVGGTLAMCGATYQGVFRNPLAEPYLIGVATGAALGSTIVLVSDVPSSWYGFSVLPLAAFAGAITSVLVVYAVARVENTVSTTTLILAGVAVASLTTAITSYLMLQSTTNTVAVFAVILGGFNTATWAKMVWALPYVIPATLVILAHGRILNVLNLDEIQARGLGIDVDRTKLLLLGVSSLAAAAAVSVSGTIGFVGLIVPHAIRLMWGPDNRHLLPLSIIGGAGFLIGADLLARTLDQPAEIPVGIITAVCGVPFFLFLLRRAKMAYY